MAKHYNRNPDPAFPNRPQHPDFQTLSEIVIRHDDQAETDDIATMVGEYLDADSLAYVAVQRGRAAATGTTNGPDVMAAGCILDGFLIGAHYMKVKAVEAIYADLEVFLALGSSAADKGADQRTIEDFRALIQRLYAWAQEVD